MNFILQFHGGIRWLVALVAVVAVVRFGLGWVRGAEFKGADRGLMAAFTGLLDLNLLFGLILLFGLGGTISYRTEHAVTMILATVAAHLSAIWRGSDDSARKFRNNLIVVVAAVVLIVAGVIRLRGGWIF